MSKAKKTNGSMLDLQVAFGQVSIGDKTARIGIQIDRGQLTPTQADKNLCELRLAGKIIAKPIDQNPDQQTFPGMELETELAGTFDVKGFSVTRDTIGLGLTFALKSVEIDKLAHFAKRSGRLIVNSVEDIPAKDPEEVEEEDEDDEDEEEE
jgi:hypothetical protein